MYVNYLMAVHIQIVQPLAVVILLHNNCQRLYNLNMHKLAQQTLQHCNKLVTTMYTILQQPNNICMDKKNRKTTFPTHFSDASGICISIYNMIKQCSQENCNLSEIKVGLCQLCQHNLRHIRHAKSLSIMPD